MDFGWWSCENVSSSIFVNKCIPLMGNDDNRGGYVCGGIGGIWEISVPSPLFSCEPKTAVKK